MQIFYSSNINNGICLLDEDETRHCIGVLRKKLGDLVQVTNGKGEVFTSRLIELGKKTCKAEIIESIMLDQLPYYLHLAVAPTKNIDRFEWFVEKAIEVGVHEITPLLCEHSERKQIKKDRLEKIALSAMKQSGNLFLPKINDLLPFESLMLQETGTTKFIAHCAEGNKQSLKTTLNKEKNNLLILIGPEGDFGTSEIIESRKFDYIPISMGKSRLRTETAALVACFTVSLHFQDN